MEFDMVGLTIPGISILSGWKNAMGLKRSNDLHGCVADAEIEAIGELERDAHDANECRRGCSYCEDEKKENIEDGI